MTNTFDKLVLIDIIIMLYIQLLLLSYLYNLGYTFIYEVHKVKNLLKVLTIANEALQHNSNNNISSTKKYIIINMRKKGQPYNQAKSFKLFDEN